MSYDPAETTTLDIIRGIVVDTGPIELLEDDTYESIIARHTIWQYAGAEVARRMARIIAAQPIALGSDGDSIRWSDERVKSLYAIADELTAAGLALDTYIESDTWIDLNYLDDCEVYRG